MKNKKTQFQIENDQIFQWMLENKFYKHFRKPVSEQEYDQYYVEFNITASCNQNCSYCYLVKNGDDIYPKELRHPETILNNIRTTLDYFVENNINPGRYDLFSGEIWGTEFGSKVLDIMLEYVTNKKITPKTILIPSNCSFVYSDTIRSRIQRYIDLFKKQGTRLVFSASVDGLYIETDCRPFKNEKLNTYKEKSENYDKLFAWCRANLYGFHPMLSAASIEKWPENYDWYVDMLKKYHFNLTDALMTLEVRNDEWTDDKIVSFLKFMNYMIDKDFTDIFEQDKQKFLYSITGYYGKTPTDTNRPKRHYVPYLLIPDDADYNCTVKKVLIIRMGDLSIGPCHRTHYPELIYGKYDIENNHIIGVTANNIQLMNRIWGGRISCNILCDSCLYNNYCIKGCIGAQFEANGEPFFPCLSVCELMKAKLNFLYHKYSNSWIWEYGKQECEYIDILFCKLEMLNKKLQEDPTWRKWTKISQ